MARTRLKTVEVNGATLKLLLHQQGLSANQVERDLGLAYNTFSNDLRRGGISPEVAQGLYKEYGIKPEQYGVQEEIMENHDTMILYLNALVKATKTFDPEVVESDLLDKLKDVAMNAARGAALAYLTGVEHNED